MGGRPRILKVFYMCFSVEVGAALNSRHKGGIGRSVVVWIVRNSVRRLDTGWGLGQFVQLLTQMCLEESYLISTHI